VGDKREHKGLWVLTSLVPMGLGTWAGFLYAARQAGIDRWKVYAGVYLACAAVGFPLAGTMDKESFLSDVGVTLLLIPWIVGVGHSFVARPEYLRRVRSGEHERLAAARDRIARRDQARALAVSDPRLAREMGIGRPDLDPAAAAGLVDLNSAPGPTIARLPGVDDSLATEIVRVREELDGFKSLEDLGMTLNLDAGRVEDLREFAIFLPR
jgi:Helix-hairpin-helix motif